MKGLWEPLTWCQLIYTSTHRIRPSFSAFCSFFWMIDSALRERKSLLINESWRSHCFTWKMAAHQTQRPALKKEEETNNSTSRIGQENRVMLFFFLLETWAHLIPFLLFSLWILPSVSFSQSWLSVDFFTIDCGSKKNEQKGGGRNTSDPSLFSPLILMAE